MKKIIIVSFLIFIIVSCGENIKFTKDSCNKCYMDEMPGSEGIRCFDKNIGDSEMDYIKNNCKLKTVQ